MAIDTVLPSRTEDPELYRVASEVIDFRMRDRRITERLNHPYVRCSWVLWGLTAWPLPAAFYLPVLDLFPVEQWPLVIWRTLTVRGREQMRAWLMDQDVAPVAIEIDPTTGETL